MSTIERDVLERLESLGLRWYVTGSWSLGVYAEPRMTRDIDIVVDTPRSAYETSIRPAFEADFLVNDPIDLGGRWMGGLIHKREIVRVDLMLGRTDAWARAAMDRRRRVEHPDLGTIWNISPEDLVLAKLEWSEGTSELQLRDVGSLVRLVSDLDWPYLERYAALLGIGDRLETVRGG
ncbi:MAG: hypothetical protein ACSLFN_13740 [Candidatus Limnocylindrales bacterium]